MSPGLGPWSENLTAGWRMEVAEVGPGLGPWSENLTAGDGVNIDGVDVGVHPLGQEDQRRNYSHSLFRNHSGG